MADEEGKKVKSLLRLLAAGPGKAKTDIDDPVARSVAAAVRTPRDVLVVAPGPAPQHTARATRRAFIIKWGVIQILIAPIPAPFPDVAAHVEQTQLICLFSHHRLGAASGII